jgi:hypothetical protein
MQCPSSAAYVKTKQLIQIDHVNNGQIIGEWSVPNEFGSSEPSRARNESKSDIIDLDALMQFCSADEDAELSVRAVASGLFKAIVDSCWRTRRTNWCDFEIGGWEPSSIISSTSLAHFASSA